MKTTYYMTLTGIVVWLAAFECGSAQLLHVSKAKQACCLPGGYGYTAFEQSDPATAYSFSGIPAVGDNNAATDSGVIEETISYPDGTTATRRAIPATSVRVKSFPLRVKTLEKDHCRISKVVVALSSDGTWSVDFLAEQNANVLPVDQRPRHLVHQQNQFHVRIRPLLGKRLVTVNAQDDVALPTMPCLHVKPFWMKRNSRRQIRAQGMSVDVRRHFDKLGHVAVDLTYR